MKADIIHVLTTSDTMANTCFLPWHEYAQENFHVFRDGYRMVLAEARPIYIYIYNSFISRVSHAECMEEGSRAYEIVWLRSTEYVLKVFLMSN